MSVARRCLLLFVAAAVVVSTACPVQAAATKTLALWKMNEGTRASVMHDSGPHSIDGDIGSAVRTGVTAKGATSYLWPLTNPHKPPAKPERLVQVHDRRLNPGNRDFAVTIRFRTTHPSANLIQKGQAGASGGYWKLETFRGKVDCLFRGRDADGTIESKSVNSGTLRLDDGQWHVVRCARTSTGVNMTIDRQHRRRALGVTGTISNGVPLTIGGKVNCDQIKVDCDYFSGAIDYVRVQKG